HFDTPGDRVPWVHRGLERPAHLKEYRARPRQLLRNDGIEDRAGDTALHDDFPEAGRLGCGVVIVQGIAVTTDRREQNDVVVIDGARELRGLTDERDCAC
ncbi:MAG: hypothetical protein QOH82_4630, partial [Mycobacterium sp.]|nr:hypothetical protein [Mycobacterium sp.]